MYNKTSRTEQADFYKPILFGLIISVIATVLILLIFSFLLTIRDMPAMTMPVFSAVSIAIGGFLGGLFSAKKAGKNGLLYGVITGAALYVIVLIASLIVSKGGVTMLTLIKLVITLISAAIGGIIGVNLKNRRKMI